MKAADGFDPSIPDGICVIAFGDVHGCLDKLQALLERIEAHAAAFPQQHHIVVSLGNLIDRGPDSAGVVERLTKGVLGCELVVLRGNHEQMLLDFAHDADAAEPWLCNGGFDTLLSYGLDLNAITDEKGGPQGLQRALLEKLPREHLGFLSATRLSFDFGGYFFVHAGVRPGVALDGQAQHDLLSIREDFLQWRKPFARKIVHGHTPVKVPAFNANRINLDTGACFGGPLSAILMQGTEATLFG
jgi:calcineurin-like phosphoesterase family protein